MMSSTRLADLGEDEFALAGGFRGKPVELVKCETNDLYVPAHAEFIIEGEIPMEIEKEGPYGEMLGYIGKETNTLLHEREGNHPPAKPLGVQYLAGHRRRLHDASLGCGKSHPPEAHDA